MSDILLAVAILLALFILYLAISTIKETRRRYGNGATQKKRNKRSRT